MTLKENFRKPNWRHALVVLLVSLGLGCLEVQAETLLDNGLPTGAEAYEMTGIEVINDQEIGGGILADDFTLSVPARLEGVQYWSFEQIGGFYGTLLWQVYSNSVNNTPGIILASGVSVPLTRDTTGSNLYSYTGFVTTLGFPSVDLAAGTYWLALHNGPLAFNFNRKVYWATTTENGTRRSQVLIPPFTGAWAPNDADIPNYPHRQLAFQLYGTSGPRVTAVSSNGGTPRVSFTTTLNQHYRVEYKNQLSDAAWVPVSGATNVNGTGGVVQVSDASSPSGRRFYRVVLL